MIWRLVRGNEEPKLTFTPYETFGKYEDVRRRVPDLSLAQSLLGYQPRVDLEAGLPATIRWQIERRRQLGIATSVTL
jgi:nucleoside-diphosphate-sugar epimerase